MHNFTDCIKFNPLIRSKYNPGEIPSVENKQQTALTDAMKDKALVGSIIKEWVREGT
jgi:hypothetical protein